MNVIKRNGATVPFDKNKINSAIHRANAECDKKDRMTDDEIQEVTDAAEMVCKDLLHTPCVEEIQDMVENLLLYSSHGQQTAKLYIRYRYLHKLARNQYDELMSAISEKLSASNVENQNANLDERSFGGRMGEATRLVTKKFALDYCMSDMARQNHLNNEIYIHDLDSYAVGEHNCFQRDTEFLTDEGIKKFWQFHDGDKTKVLCVDGQWREAEVRYFGKRKMQRVIFSRANISREVDCTPNHRWILHDGSVTQSLKVGDRLATLKNSTQFATDSAWTVKAILKQSNQEYESWCVVEPVTHSFTLNGGIVTGNCLSVPFDKLLAKGFNTRQTDVRPANSINTAFQLVAVIFQLQSLQQFGGVSATHLDWTMVPYVRKSFYKHFMDGMKYVQNYAMQHDDFSMDMAIDDPRYLKFEKAYAYATDMTTRETKQAAEGMYHNLNTLQSRSGNQLPFTSINYGTCTLPEGRMVIKALLEVSIEGLGRLHKTSIFPCGIFQLAKGINRNPGDPNYDLFRMALDSTARRLYPNYANVDWSGNEGYNPEDPKTIFSTMGCRTANGWDINGLGQQKDGRGNICPVTIILPTLAMEASKKLGKSDSADDEHRVVQFLSVLNQKLYEARDMLTERYHWICQQNPDSAKFMYENGLMEGYDGTSIESAMRHGTLAVGMLGMAETLQILVGCDQTNPKGMEVAKQICQLYKDRCAQFKKEEKLNYGVYYSPAENLCYTAMKRFKEKYGVIPNVSDKEFFTNSIHVPVWVEIDPFEKIDIECQLTGYSSAGCITYVELDSTCKNNIDALESIVNYAMDHDIPYFAVNVPNDTCMNCGYTDEIGDACPICGGHDIQRLRRVTGYLTGDYKTAFNLGKQQEVDLRVKHNRVMRR